MGVVLPHKAIEAISTSSDPKRTIQELAGDLSKCEFAGNLVLVGIYLRPEKTAGGIIRPTTNKEEDVFQGKTGLILTMGPDAFRNPETGELYEQHFDVGDWVGFYIGDGRPAQLRGMPCRLIRDTSIVVRLPDTAIFF